MRARRDAAVTGIPHDRVAVVDASLVAMWVLAEAHSPRALALASDWARADVQAVAPCFMMAEVTSALYKRVRRGELSITQAQEALEVVRGFGVQLEEEPELHRRALELAHRLDRSTPYDAHYLALAELRGCEAWTGAEIPPPDCKQGRHGSIVERLVDPMNLEHWDEVRLEVSHRLRSQTSRQQCHCLKDHVVAGD